MGDQLIMLDNAPIEWRISKQNSVCLFTMEREFVSMTQWRSVIGSLGYHTATTFFLQMFIIVFNCRKGLF